MLYIRTDMNTIIATGHVMRCLSIANAAKKMGEDTVFILSDKQAERFLNENGFETIVLNSDWNDKESELYELKKIVSEKNISKLLVDSYQVTFKYLFELNCITKVIYIDDLNAFEYPVEMIICYCNYWDRFNYHVIDNIPRVLGGMKYVPLRPVFSNIPKKQIKSNIENLLLMSGGTDNYDTLKKILNVLDKKKFKRIDVICGKFYSKYEELCQEQSVFNNVFLHKAVSDIENYMQAADFVVSAGGTTLYELSACGTPTISFSIADNQLNNVKRFNDDDIIPYAGDVRYDPVVDNVNTLINEYGNDTELRKKRSEKMQSLVDGKGATRIAKAILEL